MIKVKNSIIRYWKPVTIILSYAVAMILDPRETLVFTGVILFADWYFNIQLVPRGRKKAYKKVKEAEQAVEQLKAEMKNA